MENQEYDFFAVGQKYANDEIEKIKRMATEYEMKYGVEARRDFELGIASAMSQYYSMSLQDVSIEDYATLSATTDFGDPERINQSYVGGQGIGKPYVDHERSFVFNELFAPLSEEEIEEEKENNPMSLS